MGKSSCVAKGEVRKRSEGMFVISVMIPKLYTGKGEFQGWLKYKICQKWKKKLLGKNSDYFSGTATNAYCTNEQKRTSAE